MLRNCSFSRAASSTRDDLGAQLRDLGAQVLVLAARLESLVEPVDQVAARLERALGDLAERREHRRDATLDRVQGTAVGLGELTREQHERNHDQGDEHRSATSHLLAVHEVLPVAVEVAKMAITGRPGGHAKRPDPAAECSA